MFWSARVSQLTGTALLLLALGIIVSLALSFSFEGDDDPFDRDEIAGVLETINDNQAPYILGTAVEITIDAVVGLVVAAGLYLVFRERSRALALVGLAGLLANSIAFMVADASNVTMAFLAEDFAEKGGAGGIAVGDEVILEVARAVVIFSIVTNQIALTSLGLGLIALGVLIAWSPAAAGANPPRWLGWLGVLTGVLMILSWLIVVSDAAFVLFIASAIAALVWLIVLGGWLLLRAPQRAAPSPASAA